MEGEPGKPVFPKGGSVHTGTILPQFNPHFNKLCYTVTRHLSDGICTSIPEFFYYYFLKMHLHHSSNIKSHAVTKEHKARFSYYFKYFYLMIEGSGAVPLANGSGSGRPKNLRIRILNTDIFTQM